MHTPGAFPLAWPGCVAYRRKAYGCPTPAPAAACPSRSQSELKQHFGTASTSRPRRESVTWNCRGPRAPSDVVHSRTPISYMLNTACLWSTPRAGGVVGLTSIDSCTWHKEGRQSSGPRAETDQPPRRGWDRGVGHSPATLKSWPEWDTFDFHSIPSCPTLSVGGFQSWPSFAAVSPRRGWGVGQRWFRFLLPYNSYWYVRLSQAVPPLQPRPPKLPQIDHIFPTQIGSMSRVLRGVSANVNRGGQRRQREARGWGCVNERSRWASTEPTMRCRTWSVEWKWPRRGNGDHLAMKEQPQSIGFPCPSNALTARIHPEKNEGLSDLNRQIVT